jgi:hypothetical protein
MVMVLQLGQLYSLSRSTPGRVRAEFGPEAIPWQFPVSSGKARLRPGLLGTPPCIFARIFAASTTVWPGARPADPDRPHAGLALGANSATFSLIDRAALRPLPVEKPYEILMVNTWFLPYPLLCASDDLESASSQELDHRRVPCRCTVLQRDGVARVRAHDPSPPAAPLTVSDLTTKDVSARSHCRLACRS